MVQVPEVFCILALDTKARATHETRRYVPYTFGIDFLLLESGLEGLRSDQVMLYVKEVKNTTNTSKTFAVIPLDKKKIMRKAQENIIKIFKTFNEIDKRES